MIEINAISKQYGDTVVLKTVTATLPAQGVTAIIGANGAGKSTLLTIIGRLLKADTGQVFIDKLDNVTTASDKLAQHLSILRQENHIISRLTVRELVGLGRYPYSKGRLTSKDQQFIDDALTLLNLNEFQHRYLEQLSGGQRQRALIAMVFCQDTNYVLLDEPLNNLDIRHSVGMMKQIKYAANELGKSVIMVVHDINFASVYADHIIAMKQGAICYSGTPDQIMTADKLSDLFDIAIQIKEIEGKKIAIYY